MGINALSTYMHLVRAKEKPILPELAFPGAYSIIYVTSKGDVLCGKCATKEIKEYLYHRRSMKRKDHHYSQTWLREWNPLPIVADCYLEGPTIQCDECYRYMESNYGDPNEYDNKIG